MQTYQLATEAQPAPQTIPNGFDGHFDWPSIDDGEKARRGWVRYAPPTFDLVHERVETAFSQEDGVWTAAYTVVTGPVAPALEAAKAIVAARRWAVQNGGVTVPIGGKPTRFLSTKEGRGDIGDALDFAKAAELQANATPGSFRMSWKSLSGHVPMTIADLEAVGMAIGMHIAACFDREGAIDAALEDAATAPDATAYSVRDALAAELEEGWPV